MDKNRLNEQHKPQPGLQKNLQIFTNEKQLEEAPCDAVYAPVPNKNCKTCYGRGWFHVKLDTESGSVPHPCGCVKYVKEENNRIDKV